MGIVLQNARAMMAISVQFDEQQRQADLQEAEAQDIEITSRALAGIELPTLNFGISPAQPQLLTQFGDTFGF